MQKPNFLLGMVLLSPGLLLLLAGCGGGANADISVAFKAGSAGSTGDDDDDDKPTKPVGDPGTFLGKITVTGSPSALSPLIAKGAPLSVAKDEVCSSEAVPDERLVVGEGGGVRDVFVYMDKVKKELKGYPVPEQAVVFDQKICRFLPHAIVVRCGQTIQLWNSDPAAHNTRVKAKRNAGYNSVVNANDQTGNKSFTYKKPESEPIQVVCDFHSWMTAYHLPVDHPFAAVTNPDGTFEIKDIPPGEYRFKIWHSGKILERRVDVEIKSGSETKMNFAYAADKLLAN